MLYCSCSCTDLNYAVKRLQLSSGVVVLVDAAKVHPQIALQRLVITRAGQTCAYSHSSPVPSGAPVSSTLSLRPAPRARASGSAGCRDEAGRASRRQRRSLLLK